VSQKRAAGDWTGNDLGALDKLTREQIDQILRESPDRRGTAEQRVRVEIATAVIAVPVVEMSVDHQDLRLLQVL
jgi:hypothetical protein